MSVETIVRYKFSITRRNVIVKRCILPVYWDWVGYESRDAALLAARDLLLGRIAKHSERIETARLLLSKLEAHDVIDRDDSVVPDDSDDSDVPDDVDEPC